MKKLIPVKNWLLIGFLLISFQACSSPRAEFIFGLIGDIPYFPEDVPALKNVLEEMNRFPLAFVIHIGDFKKEKEPCSDDLYHNRKQFFEISRRPLIYTPGDNDWADCRHYGPDMNSQNSPERFPFNRLNLIRTLFFQGNPFHQDQLKLSSQTMNPHYFEYLENLRWTYNGIPFITFNMPGDGKGRHDLTGKNHIKRINAALDWVNDSFKWAIKMNSPGIVLITHANP